jgi:hypothetical protein
MYITEVYTDSKIGDVGAAEIRGMFKKRWNFFNSVQTSRGHAAATE